jgi:DNA-binding winged helix-turn-helix (wHTH) protein/tetratricopeptide (TPR) repeat protein
MDLAATAGHEVRAVGECTLRALRTVAAIVIRRVGAWERLRAWRASGVAVGVVVLAPADEPPEDRARLEPVVLLRRPDAAGFAAALAHLAVGQAPARVALATGVADLHRQTFERVDGTALPLTGLESRLLAYLAARSFRVVGRDELQEQVWGHRTPLPTKTVDMTVVRLRKKVGAETLLTVRGEGYRAVRLPTAPEPAPEAALGTLRTGVTLMVQHQRLTDAAALLDRHDRDRDPGDRRSLAESRLLRARVAQESRRPADAAEAAIEAAAIADEEGWPDTLASACCAAAANLRLGRVDEGLAYAERAEALYAAADDHVGLARALSIRSEMVDPATGFALASRAAALLRDPALVDRHGVDLIAIRASLHTRLGTAHGREGRPAEALTEYEQAAAAYAVLGRATVVTQLRCAIAQLRGLLGDPAGAEAAFAAALAGAPPEVVSVVHAAWTQHCLHQGRPADAVAHARAALGADREPGAATAIWPTLLAAGAALAAGDLAEARALRARVPEGRSPQPDAGPLRAWLDALLAEPPDVSVVPTAHPLAAALLRGLRPLAADGGA